MFACNHIGYHRRLNISRRSTGQRTDDGGFILLPYTRRKADS